MHRERIREREIQELGGEPLEGSGFETEDPKTGSESYERSTEEGFDQ
jgi:hypothetical protein